MNMLEILEAVCIVSILFPFTAYFLWECWDAYQDNKIEDPWKAKVIFVDKQLKELKRLKKRR